MPAITSIILADDAIDDVDVFKEAVDDHIELQVVKNDRELLALLDHICPDLIFLDLKMPLKNGLACLVEIRRHDKLKDIPTVVISPTSRQANLQTAYEMGGHLFLIKSHLFQELADAIKTILGLDWSNPNAIKEQYCINNRYAAFS